MCERERRQRVLAEKTQELCRSLQAGAALGAVCTNSLSVPSYASKLWKAYKTTGLFPGAVMKMGLLDRIFPLGCLTPSSDCRTALQRRPVPHCSGAAQLLLSHQSTRKAGTNWCVQVTAETLTVSVPSPIQSNKQKVWGFFKIKILNIYSPLKSP